jgi:RNA recognition motif-containing protein
MSERRDAETAISVLNGAELHGRAMNVNEARPKNDGRARPAARRSGGGDRYRSRW